MFELIRLESFKEEVDQIRAEKDKGKRDELKKSLPAVTISGLFYGRRLKQNLIKHSGLIQVDLDKVLNKNLLKKQLIQDQFSLSVFDSPSGEGLKILIKIPPDKQVHEKYFIAIERYYLLHYKIQIDKSCKDIGRLMFLSSDKGIYINERSKEIDVNVLSESEFLFTSAIQKITNKNEFKKGSRNDFVFKVACECNRLGINEVLCITYCKNYFVEIGFDGAEILNCIKSAYKKTEEYDLNTEKPKNLKNLKSVNLLHLRTARKTIEDAKTKPIPKMLFSEFWHEGEICILFADTNVGKSILAVQIANSISTGDSIEGFIYEAGKQKVYYLDFELSDKQFQKRYSNNYESDYPFDDNFLRVNINPDFTDFRAFEDQLFDELEKTIIEFSVKYLIVDNITYLKTQSTETAKDALPLMRRLKELQMKYSLSILILAHTPKRDLSRQITVNDLAGSRQLANFADSMFTIGISCKESSHRYIKQIKVRATENVYHTENVIVCSIQNPFNFLGFQFIGFGDEREHLKHLSESDKMELEQNILSIKKSNPLLTLRDIAKQANTNAMKVKRVLDKDL
ncbi:MAG: BT4734/BF3469 family protein [Chitinophagaceae bacterium]